MKYVNLNFSEVFLDRLDAYARAHGMKRNAVLKQAFELLEDDVDRPPATTAKRKDRNDDAW